MDGIDTSFMETIQAKRRMEEEKRLKEEKRERNFTKKREEIIDELERDAIRRQREIERLERIRDKSVTNERIRVNGEAYPNKGLTKSAKRRIGLGLLIAAAVASIVVAGKKAHDMDVKASFDNAFTVEAHEAGLNSNEDNIIDEYSTKEILALVKSEKKELVASDYTINERRKDGTLPEHYLNDPGANTTTPKEQDAILNVVDEIIDENVKGVSKIGVSMIDNSKFNIDGIEYTVLEKVDNYVYLVNVKDEEDVCIRKEIEEDGKTYLAGLDDEDEVYKALDLFKEKFDK